MKLAPTEPPGRITRKARHFEAEIAQLRAQGYTLAAICRSLAAAGVHVSISTVRREANRQAAPVPIAPLRAHPAAVLSTSPTVISVPIAAPATAATAATAAAATLSAGLPDPPSAKDLAEAFARSKSTNPLVRAKEHP